MWLNVFILLSLLLMLEDRKRQGLNPWMWLETWVADVYFCFYEYCLTWNASVCSYRTARNVMCACWCDSLSSVSHAGWRPMLQQIGSISLPITATVPATLEMTQCNLCVCGGKWGWSGLGCNERVSVFAEVNFYFESFNLNCCVSVKWRICAFKVRGSTAASVRLLSL